MNLFSKAAHKTSVIVLAFFLFAGIGYAEDFTSANWVLKNSDHELMVVKITGPQQPNSTNRKPPFVSFNVLRVAKLQLGLPYAGQFQAGGVKPAVGASVSKVSWSYDVNDFSQASEGGNAAREAFYNKPMAAPVVGSKWIVLMRRSDEDFYILHGRYRYPFTEKKYNEYLAILKPGFKPGAVPNQPGSGNAEVLPKGVTKGDAALIRGCKDPIVSVTVAGASRLVVSNKMRGNINAGTLLNPVWPAGGPPRGQSFLYIMGKMNDLGQFEVKLSLKHSPDLVQWLGKVIRE